MAVHYPNLFQPGSIGKLTLKNRLVMAPMGTPSLTGWRGTFSDRLMDYYERRAQGGVGLIITGVCLINSKVEPWESDGEPSLVTFDAPWKVRNFIQLTERVHDHGAKIFAQLTGGFGRVLPKRILNKPGVEPIAPSVMPTFWRPEIMTREMRLDEIQELVESCGRAALVAQMSGFDGIELHGHEGYLLDQFMTPLWNQRTDQYGGSYENRMRFALECIANIKKAVGDDFPICYRIGIEHKLPGGRERAEGIRIAQDLETAGVSVLHVDAGSYDNWHWPHPPLYQPPGCMVDMAATVRPFVALPVMTVGRLGYPALADRIVKEGTADFVAIGRPLLADPDFADKARHGRAQDIVPCIGCHECMHRMHMNQSISCAVNPECGDEVRLKLTKAECSKKVMVIGGGVAGMEAARVCALRGHQVSLYEKSGQLGGVLNIAGASEFKKDLSDLLACKLRQLEGLAGLSVVTNAEVSEATIKAEKPEVIFLATGSRPISRAPIAGMEGTPVIMPDDIYQGELPDALKVVVIGGGAVGCEAAWHMALEGKGVTIVEMLPQVAGDLFMANRGMLLQELERYSVRILTSTMVTSLAPGRVQVSNQQGDTTLETEAIVLAIGRRSENALAQVARETAEDVYVIGDSLAPRKIKDAIWEAYKFGRVV
ncbi:MAG: FAD-dependent oxidoreductase [Deltaproteobacteria bacterium]|nr:FAD-dependent oxidoreductase [Deltaproteobacteria bacterium]